MNYSNFKLINFSTFNRLKRVQRTVSSRRHWLLGNLGVSERDLRNSSYYVIIFYLKLDFDMKRHETF